MRRQTLVLILTMFLPALTLMVQSCGRQARPSISHFDGIARSADGLPIHYVTDGAGKPALVFVHGWGCDGTYWADQAAAFAGEHRVVRIDLGGHGASGTAREDYTMAAFAADVNAVADELGLADMVLIGHSMGGAVIAEAAIARPGRVRGLVGVDNFQKLSLGLSDEQIDGYLAWFRSDFSANVESWVRTMFPDTADSALTDRISLDLASAPPEVGLSGLTNLFHWYNSEAEAAFAKLPAPFFAINSDKQPTDTPSLRAAHPDYDLRLMPGRGHFLAQEDPATFNRLLAECLAALER
jgi:pimeloyl-ACP methyl ester carboxylesterase